MSRADYDDPLYRECIPQRITPTPSLHRGPTEQYRLLELDREKWQTLALFDPEEAGAA